MDSPFFQITVAVGIWLACVAFLVQTVVVIALFRRVGKLQETLLPIAGKVEPVLERAAAMLAKAAPVLDQASPAIAKIGPAIEKAGPTLERLGPFLDKAGLVVEKIGPMVTSAERLIATTNTLIEENRPGVAKLSSEVIEIAKSTREQVERVGTLLTEAGDVARTRLNQIDHTVESTVEQVGEVGDALKRAVLRPVREVNGVAAGISAAVSTLVRGSHKSSVDTATLDEEMFI